ncbi:MAG: molybdopterin-guanine dinucleotide biosynthesis protein B [Spirochaetes bacterium]|jgi:molybdopterin-guanine dinucleotide biosynthesis protein B|nr:molybdopterin-guanine dinucleotide biosynthesis protein B [Spirochaetota bacterium]
MMIPIVSLVGKSGSGKTTYIEKLIPELNRRGYRVATVKHDVHGFDMDREGKDTWRHKKAGARSIAISSPEKFAMICDTERDLTLAEIRDKYIKDADIIISEGYKKDKEPKVEIFRSEVHSEPLSTMDDGLIAFVTDREFDLGVPCFGLDDVKGLADLLEQKFLKGKIEKNISLQVNGRDIPLNLFVKDFIIKTISGMLSSLKGGEDPKNIEIRID